MTKPLQEQSSKVNQASQEIPNLHVWVPNPKNYMEAMQFDSENKNSKWYDAIKL